MRKLMVLLMSVMLVIGLGLAGCNGEGEGDNGAENGTENKETQVTAVEVELMPGLSYVDSVIGRGPEVQADDFIVAHYTGWIYENGVKGKKFDSSVDRGAPILVPLGRSIVITGWERGVPGMHIGGKRSLIIGPDLAFGPSGLPGVIPSNATLFYDIEVVEMPIIRTDVMTEGTGPVAEIGDQISVHYSGWLYENGERGQQFDSSMGRGVPFKFTLGAGNVIPGWDKEFEGMKVGTKAELIIPSIMGYGAQGNPPSIPANSTLCFEVELMEIEGK